MYMLKCEHKFDQTQNTHKIENTNTNTNTKVVLKIACCNNGENCI